MAQGLIMFTTRNIFPTVYEVLNSKTPPSPLASLYLELAEPQVVKQLDVTYLFLTHILKNSDSSNYDRLTIP